MEIAPPRRLQNTTIHPPHRNPLYHQILDYITGYINRNHYAPIFVEIAKALDISHNTALLYVTQLVKDKKLHKVPRNGPKGRLLRLGPPLGEQLPLL